MGSLRETAESGARGPVRLTRPIPVWFVVSMDGDTPKVLHIRGEGLRSGDLIEIAGEKFVVIANAPKAPKSTAMEETSWTKVGHNDEVLKKAIVKYRSRPTADMMWKLNDFEDGILEFTPIELVRDLEYSWIFDIEGGPADERWVMEAVFRKDRFREPPAIGRTYAAYGFVRRRTFGSMESLQFHPVLIVEVNEE